MVADVVLKEPSTTAPLTMPYTGAVSMPSWREESLKFVQSRHDPPPAQTNPSQQECTPDCLLFNPRWMTSMVRAVTD